jgi:hypothetical protein
MRNRRPLWVGVARSNAADPSPAEDIAARQSKANASGAARKCRAPDDWERTVRLVKMKPAIHTKPTDPEG